MKKWKFLALAMSLMLFMPDIALAGDAWAVLHVQTRRTLEDLGDGLGSMFTGMSSGIVLFIILMAVASMVGFILSAVARKGAIGEDTYQRPV
jgi:hypothetical protein